MFFKDPYLDHFSYSVLVLIISPIAPLAKKFWGFNPFLTTRAPGSKTKICSKIVPTTVQEQPVPRAVVKRIVVPRTVQDCSKTILEQFWTLLGTTVLGTNCSCTLLGTDLG